MYFCAISGEPPLEPVVSSKSGKIYERRLIVKYINENGTDPTTGEKLEESDLIAIKASPETAPPRPPNHTSIPALLHLLQNEWDSQVLAAYSLQQQLQATRQELSYALYSQDAGRRVIARLCKERDAAREALANIQASMGISPTPANGEDVEMAENSGVEGALPDNVVAQIDEVHQALSSVRKKRKPAPGYATPAEVKDYKLVHTISSLHSASPAGITALTLSRSHPSQFLTGGNDKKVQLYDRITDKVLATLKGHTKKINRVAFREKDGENTVLLSAGADKIAKAWAHDSASGEYVPKSTVRTHKGELSGLAVHPTSSFFVLASMDKTYSVHDVSNFSQIFRSAPSEEAFSSLSIHPDGYLIGLGTPSSMVQIYDIRTGGIAASLAPPDVPPFTVNSLSFSENGYHLLAPSSLSSVAVWDLRKQKATQTISLGDEFKISNVLYDPSAQFFGVAGNQGVRVFAHKTWEEVLKAEEGVEVSDFAFGDLGKEIWNAGGREVKIYSLPT